MWRLVLCMGVLVGAGIVSGCTEGGQNRCPVLDGRLSTVDIGAFEVGPIDGLIDPPKGSTEERKLWWRPKSPNAHLGILHVVVLGDDSIRREYDFAPGYSGSDLMYPGAVNVSPPGTYTITGTTGSESACFTVVIH